MVLFSGFLVEYGIEVRVVVHLHLPIHFHHAATGCVVVQQFGNRHRHIAQLLIKNVQLLHSFAVLLFAHVLTIHLLLHMANFDV